MPQASAMRASARRVAVLVVPAGAHLQRDRQIDRPDRRLEDARGLPLVAHQRRAGMAVHHLLDRAAEIDVDEAGAAVGIELGRLGHDRAARSRQAAPPSAARRGSFAPSSAIAGSRGSPPRSRSSRRRPAPAPCRLTMRRNGRSLTPDIGARMTGSASAIEPRRMLTICSIFTNA